jgi:integrase
MASLLRPTYTRPIPPGAEIITYKGKPHARYKGEDGKTVLAPLTKDGKRCRVKAEKWYGQYTDDAGVLRRVPLSTDKTVAGQMLNELVRKADLAKVGISNPYEKHRKRPLLCPRCRGLVETDNGERCDCPGGSHLADWEASLRASGATARHVRQTVANARHVLDSCGFVFMADLSAAAVQKHLAGLRQGRHPLPPLDPGKEWYTRPELAQALRMGPSAIPPLIRRHRLQAVGSGSTRRYPRATAEALYALRTRARGIRTSNGYLQAVKAFCNWLVRDRRMADNPLAHLQGGNEKLDRRHDRQTLSEGQLAAILRAAEGSAKVFRGLTGRDRRIVYLAAMTTGFRADEVASLMPESFCLEETPPCVVLPARATKNRKGATQPIPPEVAEEFRTYLAGRPAGKLLWPGVWSEKAAEMLRVELETAGIPYVIEGPDGPLYADFHSLRHSYIALLDKSGATLKEAMQLARHSDPKLTMAVYGRAQLHDLGQAVDRLPNLIEPKKGEALRATGTEPACTNLAQDPDAGCGSMRKGETTERPQRGKRGGPNLLHFQAVASDCERMRGVETSLPGRALGCDNPLDERLTDWVTVGIVMQALPFGEPGA